MSIINYQHRNHERGMTRRYNERHGLVTSYDPKKHLAKVTFQPDGEESGWIPIEEAHMGNGWGILRGLSPGTGKGRQDQRQLPGMGLCLRPHKVSPVDVGPAHARRKDYKRAQFEHLFRNLPRPSSSAPSSNRAARAGGDGS